MTPLAGYLARQLIVRRKHREHIWVNEHNRNNLRKCLDDLHCFEVTKCLPLMADLAQVLKMDENRSEEAQPGAGPFRPTSLSKSHFGCCVSSGLGSDPPSSSFSLCSRRALLICTEVSISFLASSLRPSFSKTCPRK